MRPVLSMQVTAVDLDYLRWPDEYMRHRCYCRSIVRINPYQIYKLEDPVDSALLFCFGRKTVHFHKYLNSFVPPSPPHSVRTTPSSPPAALTTTFTALVLVSLCR